MGARWTAEEDKIILDNYIAMRKDIRRLLPNRTYCSITSRANKLGLRFIKENSWTDDEKNILINNYPVIGDEVLTLLPNRSISAIRKQACNLGVKSPRSWSDDEDYIIVSNGYKNSNAVAKLLPHRSKLAIDARCHYLWEKHCGKISYPMNVYIAIYGNYKGYDKQYKLFTKRIDQFLSSIKNVKSTKDPELGNKIGTALELYYKNNIKIEYVARMMDIDCDTAKNLVNHGIAILKKILLKK